MESFSFNENSIYTCGRRPTLKKLKVTWEQNLQNFMTSWTQREICGNRKVERSTESWAVEQINRKACDS